MNGASTISEQSIAEKQSPNDSAITRATSPGDAAAGS
jgi:hypothetical protein